MTTQTGYVMTLANSIIGVSLLAMPYCFKQCGLLLAILLLFASNIVTRLACHFLIKAGVMCRRKNFEYVGYHAFGVTGKLLVELGVIGFLMGTSVAFFVVMGDLAPNILSKLFAIGNNESLRAVVLIVTGICIILPLSLLRNIESLAAISTVTILFYLLLVLKIFSESFSHLAAADWIGRVNLWRPEGVLQCFPIFAMALSCQTQIFEIMDVLPNPSVERMNAVVRAAVSLCTGVYIAVGFLGYIAYANQSFGGNILMSFSSSTISDLFQLGFVGSIALGFPIVVFPCRASLNSFLFNKGAQYQELTTATSYIPDGRFKLLTAGIVGTGLITGLLIPNIEFVLGFVGSTIGVAICIIFPAAAFINISDKKTTERLVAKCVLTLGLGVMILGIYGNLQAATDSKLQHQPGEVTPLLHSPLPPVPPVLELPKDPNKKILEKAAAPENVIESKKLIEPVILPDDKRKEPPVPIEPPVMPPEKRKEPLLPIELEKSQPKKEKPMLMDNAALPVEVPKKLEPVLNKELNDIKMNDNQEAPARPIDVHVDAIAKEEHQLREDDRLEKKEEESKKEELLKKLEEHKEEQKQLLKEQQNILEEIKIRDGEPVPIKVQPIEPKKFDENIEKIQEVIDDLKERKLVLDKTKGEKIAEEKKKNAEKKKQSHEDKKLTNADGIDEKLPVILKAIAPNILNTSSPSVKEVPVAGRDILAVNALSTLDREKREVDESCDKAEFAKTPLDHGVMPKESEINPPVDLVSNQLLSDGKFLSLRQDTRRKKR